MAGGVPYIAVILASLRSYQIWFTISAAFVCSLLTMFAYYYSPDGGELWKVLLNRLLALFVIWVTAILANRIIQEAHKEIQTLQGMIPICASCKKIRDDKGYWSQIETYLYTHSELQFSHGLCPACVKERHPEFEFEAGEVSDEA